MRIQLYLTSQPVLFGAQVDKDVPCHHGRLSKMLFLTIHAHTLPELASDSEPEVSEASLRERFPSGSEPHRTPPVGYRSLLSIAFMALLRSRNINCCFSHCHAGYMVTKISCPSSAFHPEERSPGCPPRPQLQLIASFLNTIEKTDPLLTWGVFSCKAAADPVSGSSSGLPDYLREEMN